MLRTDYQIRFNCPGFLGDAEQQSAWRTPPFKALLQHWWRIAVAKQYDYDWQKVCEAEGRLFGHAWLDNGSWAMRSRVRIKLEHQKAGELRQWVASPAGNRITHPEVKDRNTGKLRPMAPETYLAYGPLHFRDGLVRAPAINANEQNQLTLIYPESEQTTFNQTLQLIHWFGTLGGRSRNAWGSVELQAIDAGATPMSRLTAFQDSINLLTQLSRPLTDCLSQEWPHAIGLDAEGLLIWQTPARNSWHLVMKDLAQTKIKFRTDLPFPNTRPGGFEKRHLLAYPVTNHKVNDWGNNGRLANQLRFKIIRSEQSFIGIIFHLPCAMPKEMTQGLKNAPSIQQQIEIWQSVHRSLNSLKAQGLEIKRIK
jgi:CRISPR-associated protein Cmr1